LETPNLSGFSSTLPGLSQKVEFLQLSDGCASCHVSVGPSHVFGGMGQNSQLGLRREQTSGGYAKPLLSTRCLTGQPRRHGAVSSPEAGSFSAGREMEGCSALWPHSSLRFLGTAIRVSHVPGGDGGAPAITLPASAVRPSRGRESAPFPRSLSIWFGGTWTVSAPWCSHHTSCPP
jgi:hypothetical protein